MYLFTHLSAWLLQLEDEQRGKDDIREQMTSSERRAMVIAGELEELRTQLEAAERARKAAEAELHETSDRVSELASSNNSLVTSKRKLEIDIQAMQVYSVTFAFTQVKVKMSLRCVRAEPNIFWKWAPRSALWNTTVHCNQYQK